MDHSFHQQCFCQNLAHNLQASFGCLPNWGHTSSTCRLGLLPYNYHLFPSNSFFHSAHQLWFCFVKQTEKYKGAFLSQTKLNYTSGNDILRNTVTGKIISINMFCNYITFLRINLYDLKQTGIKSLILLEIKKKLYIITIENEYICEHFLMK